MTGEAGPTEGRVRRAWDIAVSAVGIAVVGAAFFLYGSSANLLPMWLVDTDRIIGEDAAARFALPSVCWLAVGCVLVAGLRVPAGNAYRAARFPATGVVALISWLLGFLLSWIIQGSSLEGAGIPPDVSGRIFRFRMAVCAVPSILFAIAMLAGGAFGRPWRWWRIVLPWFVAVLAGLLLWLWWSPLRPFELFGTT